MSRDAIVSREPLKADTTYSPFSRSHEAGTKSTKRFCTKSFFVIFVVLRAFVTTR